MVPLRMPSKQRGSFSEVPADVPCCPTAECPAGDVGLAEAELGTDPGRIIDPDGDGPRIWFQMVPEPN
jgi:hypothetical protein